MRRHNDRPEILASALPPSSVSIVDGHRTMVLCPEPGCDRWAYVQRGVLKPHHVTHQVRCPGSGQRIRIDLTRDEHLALLYKIQHAADDRHAARVHGVRPTPVLPAVCRMGQVAA